MPEVEVRCGVELHLDGAGAGNGRTHARGGGTLRPPTPSPYQRQNVRSLLPLPDVVGLATELPHPHAIGLQEQE